MALEEVLEVHSTKYVVQKVCDAGKPPVACLLVLPVAWAQGGRAWTGGWGGRPRGGQWTTRAPAGPGAAGEDGRGRWGLENMTPEAPRRDPVPILSRTILSMQNRRRVRAF